MEPCWSKLQQICLLDAAPCNLYPAVCFCSNPVLRVRKAAQKPGFVGSSIPAPGGIGPGPAILRACFEPVSIRRLAAQPASSLSVLVQVVLPVVELPAGLAVQPVHFLAAVPVLLVLLLKLLK
jgi:hypothetical protein